MKAFKYILGLIAVGGLMVSCDTDVENKTVIHPTTYDSQYYENLRNYKKSEHSIMFGYFADYDNPMTSMQIRFMGLPDSLDMISLWGGIPSKENTAVWDELRFVQKVKGTKMLVCAITHIDDQLDDLDFKKAYNEAKAMPAGEERDAALNRAIEMFAEYYLDQVFLNDLDGFDADYEPNGDFLSGSYFIYFIKHLAKYMGPNPEITEEERLALIKERYGNQISYDENTTKKLLCVDRPGGAPAELVDVCNYNINQCYSGTTDNSNIPGFGAWPSEKVIWVHDMGDNYNNSSRPMDDYIYKFAAYQPTTGYKGGYGFYYIHRDYNILETNPEPYSRVRKCIQLQNPAVY